MVGQTPEEKEEKRWRLVNEVGVAPRCMVFDYVSKGRHYYLTACVYYNERGNPHPFGKLKLLVVPSGKNYEFGTYQALKRFLERKGIPSDGIEIARLWG